MKHLLLALGLLATLPAFAAPLKAPSTEELRRQLDALKPGQFIWMPQVSPRGPVTVVLNCGTAAVPLPDGEVLLASGPVETTLPPDTAAWLR